MLTQRILIAGAGWTGLSCAWALAKAGHEVTLLEASRHFGGRARQQRIEFQGQELALDNGQHIMIGAYSETLKLMREIGVDIDKSLLRLPLTLRFPDGQGLQLPDWKKPLLPGLDVALGIVQAKGWTWADKYALLKTAALWRLQGFACAADETVASLCQSITEPVMRLLMEPLCVSALNTPAAQASGAVFLRIMKDSLFAPSVGMNSSNLLLPRVDLGALFADAMAQVLASRGVKIRLGERLVRVESASSLLQNQEQTIYISSRQSEEMAEKYDQVVIATAPADAARIAQASGHSAWADVAQQLHYEAIATVYAYAPGATLPCPMMALHSDAQQPGQFVFDRGALTGHAGLLAFVVSASQGDSATLERQVIEQGRSQLKLPALQPIKTIVDKRATFACTPNLLRPGAAIAQGLWACGDYVTGPYPSTLEGGVRSGLGVAASLQLS